MGKILFVVLVLAVLSPIMVKLLGTAVVYVANKPNFPGKRVVTVLLSIPLVIFAYILLPLKHLEVFFYKVADRIYHVFKK